MEASATINNEDSEFDEKAGAPFLLDDDTQ